MRGRKLAPAQVAKGRALRRQPTLAEQRFWNLVRNRSVQGLKFLRQYPIGPYVADFACRDRILIVEIDGSQHAESSGDAQRTQALNARGYSVLRFWNDEVLRHLASVEELLLATLAGECPDPSPWRFAPSLSPKGRGDVISNAVE